MNMVEVEISYENLFALISQEENIEFTDNIEYYQNTPIEIIDENDQWVSVKGMIKKKSESITFVFDNDKELVCADDHRLIVNDSLTFAKNVAIGDMVGNHKVVGIEFKGVQQVYDVEIDSESHLYKCSLGIIHHNTLLTAAIIKYANQLNMRVIIIVPSSSLLKQTHDYIKQFEIPVGMFGAGKNEEAVNIVATWQTLQNNRLYIKDFECIIWDECVHPSSKIRMGDNSEKRIDEINVGDLVKTINETTHQIENKPVVKIHKNILKSKNQKMFRLTMEDNSVVELTGNHEVLTTTGWKRTDELTLNDNVISLAEQFDYYLIELFLKKKFDMTVAEWFELTPTTLSRWKKKMPKKYIDIFKKKTKIDKIVDLIKEIY